MPETLDLREFGHIIEKFWAVPICCTEISWLDSRYIPEKNQSSVKGNDNFLARPIIFRISFGEIVYPKFVWPARQMLN